MKSSTDVISFNLSERFKSDITYADIVISTDRAVYNAKIFNTGSLYELYLYVVHGVLHLLGYDDRNTKQRQLMDEKAARILSILKIV